MREELIMQGDQYAKPLHITINGEPVPQSEVDDIEVVISNCRKTKSEGAIEFDEEMECWLLQLSQNDTLMMREGKQNFQVRVKLVSGDVIGKSLPDLVIVRSRSKEVL